MRVAVEPWDWSLYIVLTMDPKKIPSTWDGYKLAGALWEKRLRGRLRRKFGPFEYVVTVERHVGGSKHPHLNVLICGEGLRRAAEAAGWEWRYDARAGHGKGRRCKFSFLRSWFARVVPECGFGQRVWCEIIDDAGGLAHYMAKAASDLASARFKVGDQRPLGAPRHTHRLRASKGTIPAPPDPEEELIGVLAAKTHVDDVPIVVDRATGELSVDLAFVARAFEAAELGRAWLRANPRPVRYES